jgi:hypothetical protein
MRPPLARVPGLIPAGGAGAGLVGERARGLSRHLLYSTFTTAPTAAPKTVSSKVRAICTNRVLHGAQAHEGHVLKGH